ncbi:conserved membrane protein of unknown function [Xenorhabdus poinarii G6]|uniref:Probable membrane transporter protein n=1 Tax=Xenorhabdus poinarii G6 TaxID=1354304 RepID=A0A068R6D3_9GAMM|nr:TSUP family transporter [Xenorhabdus poinarii]CDG22733.1 conserved membrane protein of unknown function [Xenorhabdus poinarii G6]
MDYDIIFILTIIAMIAGFIDSIAGGGGLITLPALLLSGVNPVSAIATNKLQASAATFSATIAFARKGLIDWKRATPIAIMSFLGGIIGAISISFIPKYILQISVPILLIFVVLYFLFSPKLDKEERKAKITYSSFALLVAPILGFYDGVFGPGVGSFFIVSFILLMGFNLINAMSYTKLSNVACNLGSLSVFLHQGEIIFSIAISMALGASIGAQLGTKFAVRYGTKIIKPLLIIISSIMAVKLLTEPSNPIYLYITTM